MECESGRSFAKKDKVSRVRRGMTTMMVILGVIMLVTIGGLGILAVTLPENPHPRTVHVIVGAVLFSSTCCLALLCRRARTADAR